MSTVTNQTTDFYAVLHRRRDVRAGFTGDPVPPDTLERILSAAHAAPSVGLSQPWDFIVINDPVLKSDFHRHVTDERDTFAQTLPEDRRSLFDGIRIEGILDASVCVAVTFDPTRGAPAVLGRHTIADAGLYSVCLAIQNMWLAATAEDLGLGWVSFYREEFLTGLLRLPDHIRPVAWLCIGPVAKLEEIPDLERHGWRSRCDLADVVHHDTW